MNVKLLIFDFDGVLVNSEDVFIHVLHGELVNSGIDISFEDCHQRFMGHDTLTIIGEMVIEQNIKTSAEEIFARLLAKKPIWMKQIEPMAHAKNLIEKISGKIPYCVASNSDAHHINVALETVGLATYFDSSNIFPAPELGPSKPHPNVYLQALKAHNVEAQDALAIEDSVPGLTAAHAAKIPVIGFLSGTYTDQEVHGKALKAAGAMMLIHSLEDVYPLLDL